jgi:hypothetical protein
MLQRIRDDTVSVVTTPCHPVRGEAFFTVRCRHGISLELGA